MKTKYILIIAAVVVLSISAVLFYLNQEKNPTAENEQESLLSEQGGIIENGLLKTEEFSIMMPENWQKSDSLPFGSKALVINTEENVSQEVGALGFRTYFSVSSDSLAELTLADYMGLVKSEILQIDANALFSEENQVDINGLNAMATRITMNQQNIDFDVLIVLIETNGEVWSISFNTTHDKWAEYQELVGQIVNSFELK
jgi:hypothetical protein